MGCVSLPVTQVFHVFISFPSEACQHPLPIEDTGYVLQWICNNEYWDVILVLVQKAKTGHKCPLEALPNGFHFLTFLEETNQVDVSDIAIKMLSMCSVLGVVFCFVFLFLLHGTVHIILKL